MALAPMAGVTDAAFRHVCSEMGADVVYSEMANVTALRHQPQKTLEMLQSIPPQAPYVIQLFGSDPEEFGQAASFLMKEEEIRERWTKNYHAPDGIDINFGCPVPKVAKAGAGTELSKDLKNSYEVIRATIENSPVPVSIKTRTRAHGTDVLDFLEYIKDLEVSAVMIHGRTLSQQFSGEVDTDTIKQAKSYTSGVILANGGIMNGEDADEMIEQTEADGVGIARGSMGNPWIFRDSKKRTSASGTAEEIYNIALKQAQLAYQTKGEQGIIEMRKHLCWYVSGLPNASRAREKLVQITSVEDIEEILNEFVIR